MIIRCIENTLGQTRFPLQQLNGGSLERQANGVDSRITPLEGRQQEAVIG